MIDWSQIVKIAVLNTTSGGVRKTPRKYKRRIVTSRKRNGVDWVIAEDVQKDVEKIIRLLEMDWIDLKSIFCFRSENSHARAYARIWGLSKIWQIALGINAKYCIEVLSENYDHLSSDKKAEVLIHEICHIPKNFSGSLLPHTRKRGKRNFHDRVHEMVSLYSKNSKKIL